MTDAPQDEAPTPPAAPEVPPPRVPERRVGVVVGIALVLAAHLVLGGLVAMITGGVSMFLIGVTQLVYVIPGIIVAHVKGERHIRLGIIIGAAVTFLLNAACFGVLAVSLGGMH